MSYVPLHVHSHYSLLNGLAKIKPLVKTAKKRGFDALALTDDGAMYGAIEFYKACQANEVKPIIGMDSYIVQDEPVVDEKTGQVQEQKIFRIVLLAENYDGYRNLMILTSRASLDGFYNGKPCIHKDLLKKYCANIIALSGSIEGEIPQAILENDIEKATGIAKEYEEIFGKGNFFLELNDHPAIEGQNEVNNRLIDISKQTGIELVVGRNVHYLEPEEAEAQDILRCISNGWKVDYLEREDFRDVDRSLNTQKELAARFEHVPEALENTGKIADRINLELELDNWHFAPVDLPEGKTADEHLRDESYRCVTDFYPELTDELTERIDYELGIIKTKGYSPYFICVADYVGYAKRNGIVESTRGSAAGSLVSYVLGITTVDPMRFKLPFERFLNPFRPSPPDIDTDFADDRREEMIEYVTKKYGADKVAQIITFGTMAARAACRDVGRALGYSYTFCDQVAKLIPTGAQGFPMTIERALKEEPDLKKLFDSNPQVQTLLNLAQQVEGCARHTSIHAAGVVISPTPLVDFSPVQRETGGERITTQYEMKSVESAGVLKNDFLGIRNLAILGNAVEIVLKTTGDKVDIYDLPLDDTSTFEMLARGETMGVFQMSGSGMTRWLKELKPNRIEDIMAMVALYRPGPMESIPEYIRRKYDPEAVSYPDPRLEKILEASYGLLVYQDDVMLTAIELAGYDWMEADKFRKAMGKKIPEEMAKQKIKFYDGCKKHGNLKKETMDELWHAIEPFAAYGFNKAHAASYGIVAYQTAYMKAHYPVQFMTSVLQAESGDNEKISAIVHACRNMKIDVLPPDINESFRSFAMVSKQGEPGRIRFGLSAIKNVGANICDVVYEERKKNGPYKSIEDLLERVQDKDMNKRSLDSMVKAGALDSLGHERGQLVANMENVLYFSKQLKEKATTHQDSLFAGTDIALDSKVVMKQAPPATMEQKLVWEKTLLGIYVSSHPFMFYESAMEGALTPLAEVEEQPRDDWVSIGGVIDGLQKKITKKGSVMMFATLQDTSGSVELLVFPKTYEKTQGVWEVGKVVCIVGRTPKEVGDNKVFAENVYELNKANAEEIGRKVQVGNISVPKKKKVVQESSMSVTMTQEDAKEHGKAMKKLFADNPGDSRVYIRLGAHTIKSGARITPNTEVRETLKELIPGCSIDVN